MSSNSKDSHMMFKKDFLSGYTGHVPTKSQRFGSSTGQIKQEIIADLGRHTKLMERLNSMSSERPQLYSPTFEKKMNKSKEIFGNHSKQAMTWIGGPFNEVRHQHIPGYKGHIKGLIAENIHADKPEMIPKKDFDDYSSYINDTYRDGKFNLLSSRFNNDQPATLPTSPRHDSTRSANDLSREVEAEVIFNKKPQTSHYMDFRTQRKSSAIMPNQALLSLFSENQGNKSAFIKKDRKFVIPIAGYGGHRCGQTSANFFGKSFRESSIQSKKLEQDLRLKTEYI